MSLGVLLDVSVSILAVMVLFTLAASAINEFIADNLRNLRGVKLREALSGLLEQLGKEASQPAPEALIQRFYEQPDIKALMEKTSWLRFTRERRLPSAIEPKRFALTVLELFGQRADLEKAAKEEIEAWRATLVQGIEKAGGDPALVESKLDGILEGKKAFSTRLDVETAKLELRFGEVVARAQGWYLRSTRNTLFVIGLVLAAGANIDLLRYADRLMSEANIADRAQAAVALVDAQRKLFNLADTESGQTDDFDTRISDEIESLATNLAALDVRVGWSCLSEIGPDKKAGTDDDPILIEGSSWLCEKEGTAVPRPNFAQVVGWIIIAFGVTLGAQFWFDLFRRLVNLRTSGQTLTAKLAHSGSPAP